MARDDFDTPRIPPGTPPAIDPDAAPKTSAEMEAEGEEEGEVLGHRSDPDQIDTELSDKLKRRDARDGMGEEGLDEAPPEAMLPPD